MQTVKIGDVEYPWPEGCRNFIADKRGLKTFSLDPESGDWEWFVDKYTAGYIVPIIASVAAMHFENLMVRKRKAMSWEPETPAIREMNSRLCAEGNRAEAAAAAWRELCREV